MYKKSFFKSISILFSIAIFAVSCDKDFAEIGSDIIGDDHFDYNTYTEASVNAFNQATEAVESSNLTLNSLGIYVNPVFGKTKSNFVTQLTLVTTAPTFNPDYLVVHKDGTVLDSVVLTVPYFSKKISSDATGSKYELDSIHGSGTIDLKIFESGYYMSDFDPDSNFESYQKYYTNQDHLFNNNKVGTPLNNNTNPIENTQFQPSAKEFVVYKRDENLVPTTKAESRNAPRMSLHLDKNFFETKILKAPAEKLANNNAFKNYFRGLYFQVANADAGQLMQLNFAKGDITLYYSEYAELVDHDNNPETPKIPATIVYKGEKVPKKVLKKFVLNLTGNTANLIEQTNSSAYASAIAPRPMPPLPNDGRLYVKGGSDGSAVIIDLFGPDNDNNGVADELETIRKNGWMINEANLTFHIDQTAMSGAPEPSRVLLFDVTNRRPLYDYYTDATTTSNPKLNKQIHSGILIKESSGKGTKYKIRITDHIRTLLKHADSTNVRLGLVVTESIALVGNSKLEKPVAIPYPFKGKKDRDFDRIPISSVLNPFGTILYGSGNDPINPVPEEKKLKLEIFYTKPN
ncbi:MAG: DUF4270 domain-containing protein [Flavobacterium sp.]